MKLFTENKNLVVVEYGENCKQKLSFTYFKNLYKRWFCK